MPGGSGFGASAAPGPGVFGDGVDLPPWGPWPAAQLVPIDLNALVREFMSLYEHSPVPVRCELAEGPLYAWYFAPALAAGCSVIVKPAQETTLTTRPLW